MSKTEIGVLMLSQCVLIATMESKVNTDESVQ